jgi:hypothetical protein
MSGAGIHLNRDAPGGVGMSLDAVPGLSLLCRRLIDGQLPTEMYIAGRSMYG